MIVMQDFDATVGIFSKVSILTDKLEERFREKYLDVCIFDNINDTNLKVFSYLIVNMLEDNKDLSSIKNKLSEINCKVIILLPLSVPSQEKYVMDMFIQDALSMNNNLGVILVPDLLGYGVKLNERNISHNLIVKSLTSNRIKLSDKNLLVNTISLSKLIDVIVKETFSFGVSGQSMALIGPRINSKSFVVNYLGITSENIIFTKDEPSISELDFSSSFKLNFSLSLAVNATKNTFLSEIEDDSYPPVVEVKSLKSAGSFVKVKSTKKKKVIKNILRILFLMLAILLTPIFLMLLSIVLLFFAFKNVSIDNAKTQRYMNYSLKSIESAQRLSFNIPFYYDYSNIIYKTTSLFKETVELSRLGSEFVTRIMREEPYDLASYSDSVSAILDKLHTDISFLQSDMNELNGILGTYIRRTLFNSSFDAAKYKNKTLHLKELASRLSYLLGMEKPMKYLILFQNNMELRPTGGFIGSFAMISFDKGRLSEIVVNDVYSADGQLKGHVDPPEPIRIHLGEGGWYMRDANWDPSFPDSAKKIEWFLDKEINTVVDGVISIDLHFVQSLLRITGPIRLSDYDKTIDSNNLYINTQEEVESDFFPGSIKKASFITALSKQLMLEIESISSDKYFGLIKEIYESLETKHVQIYLHDLNAQSSVEKLGYSGSVNINTDCGPRCFNDSFALVDANLGVNKSNIFINRNIETNIEVSKNTIDHELLVTYTNAANSAIGNSGVYKSYTRLLLPIESNIYGVRVYNLDGSYEDVPYEVSNLEGRKEVGFLVKILPEDLKKIQIVWNITTESLKDGGEFDLEIIKQSGTDKDSLLVKFKSLDLVLTGRVPSVYTTTLERDFEKKLYFK